MSERRRQAVAAVAQLLAEAEMLSETAGSSAFEPKVKGGESDGVPQGGDSVLDRRLRKLEEWCAYSRREIERAKVNPAGEMTSTQEDYWFLREWEGVDYTTVADATGIPRTDVYAKRQRLGVNPRDGTPKAA